jgi:hypothetical protein
MDDFEAWANEVTHSVLDVRINSSLQESLQNQDLPRKHFCQRISLRFSYYLNSFKTLCPISVRLKGSIIFIIWFKQNPPLLGGDIEVIFKSLYVKVGALHLASY